MGMFNAKNGIILLLLIICMVAVAVSYQIEGLRVDQETLGKMDTYIVSYEVDGNDVVASISFDNVSSQMSAHLEVRSYRVMLEGRVVSETVAKGVDIIPVSLRPGNQEETFVFRDVIDDESIYKVEIELVAALLSYRYEPIFVFL